MKTLKDLNDSWSPDKIMQSTAENTLPKIDTDTHLSPRMTQKSATPMQMSKMRAMTASLNNLRTSDPTACKMAMQLSNTLGNSTGRNDYMRFTQSTFGEAAHQKS